MDYGPPANFENADGLAAHLLPSAESQDLQGDDCGAAAGRRYRDQGVPSRKLEDWLKKVG